jgi:hypothetical protein
LSVLGIILGSAIAALFVATIVAAVGFSLRQERAARLRSRRVEEEERLLGAFRTLSRRRRGTAVPPARAAKQAGLEHPGEALERLLDGGYISPVPGRPGYFALTEVGWSRRPEGLGSIQES